MGDVNLEIKLHNVKEKTDKIIISGASDGQVLTYDETSGNFVPENGGSGSGYITSVTNDFKVTGGELAFSDEFADTLDEMYTTGVDSKLLLENNKDFLKGKNLLKHSATTNTSDGITFTVNADESITLTGSNTKGSIIFNNFAYITNLKSGTEYILSSNGLTTTDKAYLYMNGVKSDGSGSDYNICNSLQDKMTFVADYTTYSSYQLGIGVNVDFTPPKTIYPMIRLASITDDTYEPYSKSNVELTSDVATLPTQDITSKCTFDSNITWRDTMCFVKRSGNVVYAQLFFTTPSTSAETLLVTLPEEVKPKNQTFGIMYLPWAGGTNGMYFINTNGQIKTMPQFTVNTSAFINVVWFI